MNSNKEYKKLYLVSPSTFEKISKDKQSSKVSPSHALPSSKKTNPNSHSFQEDYLKWMKQRNKLALQSIIKRRLNSDTSNSTRKLHDKIQLQRAIDKDNAVLIQPTIPLPPKTRKSKILKAILDESMGRAKYKPVNLFVRNKIPGEKPMPLKRIKEEIKAAEDEILNESSYLTDDESNAEVGFYENSFKDGDEKLEPKFQEMEANNNLQHLVSSLFLPDSKNYSTPLTQAQSTPSSALRNLNLNSSKLSPLPIYSSKKRTKLFTSPEPMDVLSPRKDDLGSEKWFNRFLGRPSRPDFGNWESFD